MLILKLDYIWKAWWLVARVVVLRLLEMKSRFESDIDRGTAGAGTRFPQDRPIGKT